MSRPAARAALAAALLALPCACGEPEGDDDTVPADDDTGPEPITGIPNLPGGNPLVPEVALYPWPSDYYLVEDAATRTGRRVELPAEAMPGDLSPNVVAGHDGFTRIPAILAYFEGGIDPASLPDAGDPGASLASDSPVLLLREGDWEPVPVLAELDLNAASPAEQALILRPHVPLEPGTGYAVVLTDALRSADGSGPPPVTDAFRALRDGIPTDSAEVEAQRDDFRLVLDALEGVGLDPARAVLAWSFHTRSEEQVVAPLLAMQDAAMAAPTSSYAITSDAWEGDGSDRIVEGTFTAPDFLGEDHRIQLDAQGVPVQRGTREVPFVLTIPSSIDSGPRPFVLAGHGFFSTRYEPTWGSMNDLLHRARMTAASTDFIGFNEDDLPSTLAVLGDLSRLGVVIDEQLQSHVDFTVLARLVRDELADEVVSGEGADAFPVLDPGAFAWIGASNGGTQGLVQMATSPLLTRAVLVVPGGGWTHMLQRATEWVTLGALVELQYPDPLDLQLAMGILQNVFDPADSLNYVSHLVDDRFPGRPEVRVTLHEAVGDCQVSNLVTEWVARQAGIPLVVPSPVEIWGLDTIEAPAPAGASAAGALFVYDEGYPPLPAGNVPPPDDNGAHGSVRSLDVYQEHVTTFLETGAIVQVCDGACDPD